MWNPPVLHRVASRKTRATGPWALLGRYSYVIAYMPMILSATAVGLAVLRYLVVFFETFSIVRSEREQDHELLELCASGAGRSSPRMQATCMDATAARASPLLLAVFMRSASVFGHELYSLVAQPLQSVTGLSMLTVVGIAPWLAPLKTFLMTQLLRRGTVSAETDYRDDHIVVLSNGSFDDLQGGPLSHAAMRFRGIPQRMLGHSDQVEEGKERHKQPTVDENGFSEITIAPSSPERSNTFLRQSAHLWGGRRKQD